MPPPPASLVPLPYRPRPARHRLRTAAIYTGVMLREFRYTLLALAALVSVGAVVFRAVPGAPGAPPLSVGIALYGSWMAMLAQPLYNPPPHWSLALLCAAYPVMGFVLVGEGVVRLALLMVSRRHGQREWMRVMASTYRDHVILCGLGHLGYRVLEQLLKTGLTVVVLEKHKGSRHITHAKELGAVVLIRDMKEDQALIDAGIRFARAVVIATNDDMANLEVALDSRRLNPAIRVVMRLFDQQIAQKVSGALSVDAAFSSSALAAPMVAALSLNARTLSTYVIGGVPHVAAELTVSPGCPLEGHSVAEVELGYAARVLARTAGGNLESPPTPATRLAKGDVIVVHTAAAQLPSLAVGAGCATA